MRGTVGGHRLALGNSALMVQDGVDVSDLASAAGELREQGASVMFLARDGGFVNGVTLPVDGGWTGDVSWDSLRLKTRD